jgi:hypothetical protein
LVYVAIERVMRWRTAVIAVAAVGAAATVPPITDGDDGADTREAGTVVIIGPPPPGGGGSVSAVGTGCTTRGATTKLPSDHVLIDIDAGSIELPEIGAGVTRIVARNFDSEPHGLVLTELDSVGDLPLTEDGFVDEEALPNKVFRIAEFPGNTICEGTFELPAGRYVVFSPSPEGRDDTADSVESDVSVGVVAELTIGEPDATTTVPSTAAVSSSTG